MISARLIICALSVNFNAVRIFVKLNANKVSRAHVLEIKSLKIISALINALPINSCAQIDQESGFDFRNPKFYEIESLFGSDVVGKYRSKLESFKLESLKLEIFSM